MRNVAVPSRAPRPVTPRAVHSASTYATVDPGLESLRRSDSTLQDQRRHPPDRGGQGAPRPLAPPLLGVGRLRARLDHDHGRAVLPAERLASTASLGGHDLDPAAVGLGHPRRRRRRRAAAAPGVRNEHPSRQPAKPAKMTRLTTRTWTPPYADGANGTTRRGRESGAGGAPMANRNPASREADSNRAQNNVGVFGSMPRSAS
jgi:hypothetical protein